MPFVAHRVFNWAPAVIDESWGLQTIPAGNACSICNSLYCLECGLLFLDIRFDADELGRLYFKYRGEEYTELRDKYEPGYRIRNSQLQSRIGYLDQVESFIRKFVPTPSSLLDWGGGSGVNTPFTEGGCEVFIYDISSVEVVTGLSVLCEARLTDRQYDVIHCTNVLEHVSYPLDLILEIKSVMHLDTLLYIQLPFERLQYEGQHEVHTLKRHWHEHINFFSEKSIMKMLERAELEVLELRILRIGTADRYTPIFQVACRI